MTGNDLRFWIVVWVTVFMFIGEPDVWDKLHDMAMSVEVCK